MLSGTQPEPTTAFPRPTCLWPYVCWSMGAAQSFWPRPTPMAINSVTFQPLPQEAGVYSINADHPGVLTDIVQGQFTIVGLSSQPASNSSTIVPGTPYTGQFTLTILSNVPLTGLTAVYQGGPSNTDVQLTLPQTVAGPGSVTLSYTFTASATGGQRGAAANIKVTSAKGEVLNIPLGVSVVPLTPQLSTNPGYLVSGMLVGTTTNLRFHWQTTAEPPRATSSLHCPVRLTCLCRRQPRSHHWPPGHQPRSPSASIPLPT